MKIVADASVTIAWLFAADPAELNCDRAIALFAAVGEGKIELIQPPHWIAETAAVVVRKAPARSHAVIEILKALQVEVEATAIILSRAATMSATIDHHLFDTLYHALALEAGATLVTADERYFEKAVDFGGISLLAGWNL